MTSFEEFKKAHANYSSVPAFKEESWTGVVDMLNREGWTPMEYIDYVFKTMRKALTPSLLASEKLVEGYKEARLDRIDRNTGIVKWMVDQMRGRLENGFSLDEILSDGEFSRLAIISYVMAMSAKRPDLAEPFKTGAEYELGTMPELTDITTFYFERRFLPC